MSTYEFVLSYQLQSDMDIDELVDALYTGGCDDTLIGHGLAGRISLQFYRRAESAHAAISEAVKQIKGIAPRLTLLEASPDLVGCTDIARILSVSRQYVLKLTRKPEFPGPKFEGSQSLWYLSDVIEALQALQKRKVAPEMIEVAQNTRALNHALASVSLPKSVSLSYASII